MPTSLTKRQVQFVNEVAKDDERSATKCAIAAGYSPTSAYSTASDLLKSPEIQKAIAERREQLAAAAGIDSAWWYRQMASLIQPRCCRYCYGIGNKYQWTAGEYRDALDEALMTDKPAPDFKGGLGFNQSLPPAPGCPECCGAGDPGAIKVSDKLKALELFGRAVSAFKDAPAAVAIATASVAMAQSPDELTDDQLMALIAQNTPQNEIERGIIEGTLQLVDSNSLSRA